MELTQDGNRVQGFYTFQQNSCPIEGSVRDGRLLFTYQEPTVEGEGWFELVRHSKFSGQWRPKGAPTWSSWNGEREFEGIWDSSYGLMRLVQEPDRVLGFYEGVGPATVEGRLENNRLTVTRAAPRRTRQQLPFGVWMALAKATPVAGLNEDAQGMLGGSAT